MPFTRQRKWIINLLFILNSLLWNRMSRDSANGLKWKWLLILNQAQNQLRRRIKKILNGLKRATAATSLLGLSASIVKSCDGACQHVTVIVFRGHTCTQNDVFQKRSISECILVSPRFLAFLCERNHKTTTEWYGLAPETLSCEQGPKQYTYLSSYNNNE